MRELNNESKGRMILIYSETGIGKTTSSLASLPEPILCIYTEPRDPSISLKAIGKEVNVKFVAPDSYDDLIEFLNTEAQKETVEYSSLLFDSLSYFMNVQLSQALEDETFEAEIFKRKRTLVDMTRKDEAAFGAVSSLMKRICRPLGILSQKGVIVVCTALLSENPKYNRELFAAPAFIGRDFPTNAPAYFDAIGLVEKRLNTDGDVIYPPTVKFEGDGFVCKWSGVRGNKKLIGSLDFKKILTK